AEQLKVASGQVDGATHLALLHEQLARALDAKAQAGPLGSALLSAGKHALTEAARAWADPKRNKQALVGDINKVLQAWGPVPVPTLAPLSGTRARATAQPAEVARVIDLLGLPVPAGGAVAAAIFLDGKGKLAEGQVAYRPGVERTYPTGAHLNYRLAEAGFAKKDSGTSTATLREVRGSGSLRVVADRVTRGRSVGALVRVQPDGKPGPGALPRSL